MANDYKQMNNDGPPNILLIVSDQQRYDCIGYSRDYPVKTPNIDRLASQGMWFTNAFTPIPLCCPARQAMLNGRRPESFGALWNYDITLKTSALEPTEYSWTKQIKELGYQMGYVGKWHVHPKYTPLEYGYDEYIGEMDYDAFRKKKYPQLSFQNGWLGEIDPVPLEDARTHWFAQKAIGLIKEFDQKKQPWHIQLDFPEPHLPCQPVEQFAQMYDPQEIPEWRSFRDEFVNKPYIQKQQLYNWNIENFTWNDWAPIVARYYAIISQMDDAIGKVLNTLETLGISENTIVIYTSDHGDMCGSHRMLDKHYVLYDDIVRVPLVIRWPKIILENTKCQEFVVHFLDLAPTILDILGLEQKEFFHGRSLVPLLQGKEISDWRQHAVSTYNGQQFGLYTQRMIRNNKWKYVWNATDIDELYDLENDPGELNNLIYEESCRPILKELRQKLYEELLKDGDDLVKNSWFDAQLLNNKKL